MKNVFTAMAVMAAVYMDVFREHQYREFVKAVGTPPSRRHHEPGAYGKGLRKSFTAKNLARRANGQKMVAA